MGAIAAVAEQLLRLGQRIQQGCHFATITDLAGGHEQAQGAAVGAADGLKLGVHAAFDAADQAPKPPVLPPASMPCSVPKGRSRRL